MSGSDDFNIIVWEALKYRIGCKMNSGHSGNIFSVKVRSFHEFCEYFTVANNHLEAAASHVNMGDNCIK